MGKLDEKTLIGSRYHSYVVIDAERRQDKDRSRIYVKILCDCGNITWKSYDHVYRDKTCGCNQFPGKRTVDMDNAIGMQKGKTTIVAMRRINEEATSIIECLIRCECGTEKWVNYNNFKRGHYMSCGCERYSTIAKKKTTHGGRRSRLYQTYHSMLNRCYNPNIHNFKHYGGRGIIVCDEWRHSFVAFRDWALSNGYSDDLSIDRIDVNGIYEPSNCRWATYKQQARNTTRNRWVELNGQTKTLSEWAEIYNISPSAIQGRLYIGWDIEKAITTPLRRNNERRATEVITEVSNG